jgi:Arc/MetJ-type ribon-helix-helix transcriptional regulator
MTSNTKSSVTLPAEELRRVKRLKAKLRLRSNVDVVRAGLRLLEQITDRDRLREEFRRASIATREALRAELDELDHLAGEGLD